MLGVGAKQLQDTITMPICTGGRYQVGLVGFRLCSTYSLFSIALVLGGGKVIHQIHCPAVLA